MKRLTVLLLALTLLAAGCQKQKNDQPDAPQTPQQPITTDSGQITTLQDYYDRTAIIARNECMDGDFNQTVNWALEYAALISPDTQKQADFISGYVLPAGMVPPGLEGGATLWRVRESDASAEDAMTVQIFYFSEKGQIWFSGLLSGEQVVTTRPEGYAYLALDTRYASRLQALPAISTPDGAEVVNLADLTGPCLYSQVYVINAHTAAVYCRQVGETETGTLFVLYLDDSKVLGSKELTGSWELRELRDSVLTLDGVTADGVHRLLTATAKGKITVKEVSETAAATYAVGNATVTERENSIYLNDTPLLPGNTQGAQETWTRYQFEQALDDHRFSYTLWGYEWVMGSGVYDLSSGTDHPLTADSQSGRYLLGASGNTAVSCLTDGGSYAFAVTNLTDMTMRPLPLGHETQETRVSSAVVNADCTRLALWNETEDVTSIQVYDTASGALLWQWEYPAKASYATAVTLLGDDTVCVSMQRFDTDSSWLYRIAY